MITDKDKELYEKVKEIIKDFSGPRMVLTGLKTEADAVWQLHRLPGDERSNFVRVVMSKTRAPQERAFMIVNLDKINQE